MDDGDVFGVIGGELADTVLVLVFGVVAQPSVNALFLGLEHWAEE